MTSSTWEFPLEIYTTTYYDNYMVKIEFSNCSISVNISYKQNMKYFTVHQVFSEGM